MISKCCAHLKSLSWRDTHIQTYFLPIHKSFVVGTYAPVKKCMEIEAHWCTLHRAIDEVKEIAT